MWLDCTTRPMDSSGTVQVTDWFHQNCQVICPTKSSWVYWSPVYRVNHSRLVSWKWWKIKRKLQYVVWKKTQFSLRCSLHKSSSIIINHHQSIDIQHCCHWLIECVPWGGCPKLSASESSVFASQLEPEIQRSRSRRVSESRDGSRTARDGATVLHKLHKLFN